jgi:hypothetical protein
MFSSMVALWLAIPRTRSITIGPLSRFKDELNAQIDTPTPQQGRIRHQTLAQTIKPVGCKITPKKAGYVYTVRFMVRLGEDELSLSCIVVSTITYPAL